jgi:hypothetical protein
MSDNPLPRLEVVESVQEIWGENLIPVGCPKCKQAFLIPSQSTNQVCPRCASASLVAQPVQIRPEPPELILPFKVSKANLSPTIDQFVKSIWLRPDDFSATAIESRLSMLFLPLWLVDSSIQGDWRAEVGFNYKVKSSQDSFRDGSWQSRDVVETRTRWEARSGTIDRQYQNVAAPALVHQEAWSKSLGTYQYSNAQPYSHGQVDHACIHVPDLPPEEAWPQAKTALNQLAQKDCASAAGADHIRNATLDVEYPGQNWTQMLLPVLTSYYLDDDRQPHIVMIHGQTGVISGDRVASQAKGWRTAGIAAAIAVGVFLVSLLSFAMAALFPPIALLAIPGVLVAIGLVIYAIVAAVYPWQQNRKNKEIKVTRK